MSDDSGYTEWLRGQMATDLRESNRPVEMETRKVGELQPNMIIKRGPYYGPIASIVDHGRSLGDGTVDWHTLRIFNRRERFGGQDPYTTVVGPLRADAELEVEILDSGEGEA